MINWKNYPLHDASQVHLLIERCRTQLTKTGACLLRGFVDASVVPSMVREVSNLQAWHRKWPVTAYHSHGNNARSDDDNNDADVDATHPQSRLWHQDVHAVAGDRIPHRALIRQLYSSPVVKAFLAAVLDCQALYEYGDTLQCLNVMYMRDGGKRAWHYDKSDCVITVMLQPAAEGGQFQFAPFIRGHGSINAQYECEDEHYDDVRALFEDRWEDLPMPVHKVHAQAGDLLIFNGMRSLHRVTPVRGSIERIVAVLSYDSRPLVEQTLPTQTVNDLMYGPRVKL